MPASADEFLWAAKTHPASIDSIIAEKRVQHLARPIAEVIEDSTKTIRRDYPDIISREICAFMLGIIINGKRVQLMEKLRWEW